MKNPNQTVVVKLSDLNLLANVVAEIDSENSTKNPALDSLKQPRIRAYVEVAHDVIASMAGDFSEDVYPSEE